MIPRFGERIELVWTRCRERTWESPLLLGAPYLFRRVTVMEKCAMGPERDWASSSYHRGGWGDGGVSATGDGAPASADRVNIDAWQANRKILN